jgi:hypothetical protein
MSSLHQDGLGGMSMKLLPIPAAPLCIYGIRWMVEAYYRRSITHQCEHLESLKKQQRQKIEEMKQKMNYYTAKTLIERYDESAAPDTKGLTKRHSRSDFVPMAAGEIKNNAEAEEIQSGPATAEYSDKPRLSMAPNDYPPEVFNSQRPLYRKDISAAVYANPHPLPQSRTWIDRVLDLIVGEETSPSTKYALVCEKCFHHNGLALEEELDNLKYTCPHCGHLNLKRKTGQLTTESLIGQSNEIT